MSNDRDTNEKLHDWWATMTGPSTVVVTDIIPPRHPGGWASAVVRHLKGGRIEEVAFDPTSERKPVIGQEFVLRGKSKPITEAEKAHMLHGVDSIRRDLKTSGN